MTRTSSPGGFTPSITALVAVAMITGCAPGSDSRGPESRSSSATLDLSSSDIHRFDTPEAIADVRDLEVLDDGQVVVHNSVAPFFVAFDPSGAIAYEYGAQGGGPEEFRMPAGFVVGGIDGDAWVLDLQRHALVRIAGPDAEWTERRISAYPPGTLQGGMGLLTSMVRTAAWQEDVVVPHSTGTLQSGPLALVETILKADLALLTPDASQARTVVELGAALDDPLRTSRPPKGNSRCGSVCGPCVATTSACTTGCDNSCEASMPTGWSGPRSTCPTVGSSRCPPRSSFRRSFPWCRQRRPATSPAP